MSFAKVEYKDHETVITADNMNDIQDAILDLEDGLFSIDNDKSGEVITITDAAKRRFRSLNIYGKTTQDGVPTPDAPMELVSVGDSGSISVKIASVNLAEPMRDTAFTDTGVTFSPTEDSNLILNGTVSGELWKSIYRVAAVRGQTYTVSGALGVRLVVWCTETEQQVAWKEPTQPYISFTADYSKYVLCVSHNANETFNNLRVDCAAYLGNTALPWKPYNGQSATIYTPNGLPGIPVTSGGNYTDASGQQWICDEIDFARGVFVQRCGECVIDGSSYISVSKHSNGQCFCTQEAPGIIELVGNDNAIVLCDRYIASPWTNTNNKAYCIGRDLVLTDNRFSDKNTALSILSVEKPKCIYVLATPIETPLSEEELAAYAALHTYKDHTTVSNDAGAYMELEYAMDAKKYIDGLVTGTIVPATVE